MAVVGDASRLGGEEPWVQGTIGDVFIGRDMKDWRCSFRLMLLLLLLPSQRGSFSVDLILLSLAKSNLCQICQVEMASRSVAALYGEARTGRGLIWHDDVRPSHPNVFLSSLPPTHITLELIRRQSSWASA